MSLTLNEAYWQNRYLLGETGWDIGHISSPLKDYFDQLSNKNISILVPGAGNAYEAEYLVNNGFSNVYVCDLSQEPLNNLQQRCPAIKKENLIHGDFFELNTAGQSEQNRTLTIGQTGQSERSRRLTNEADSVSGTLKQVQSDFSFDLIIEQTFFCALDPSLRKKYFEKMHELLKPGGRLVGLLFNDVLNTDKPPFGGNKEEYLSCFGPEFKIHVFDTAYNSIKPRQGRELFINLESSGR